MDIILEDIDKLIPYARNPRKNQAIDKVAASIREFGFRQPIVVDKKLTIIAGHTRYEASKKLGLKKVPIHIAKELTPVQIKAYRIADNRVAQDSEWDIGLLNYEFTDLLDENYDLNLLGFDLKELEDLIVDKENKGLTDEDAIPEVPDEPTSKLGDVYQLGNHRLMCGDAIKEEDVNKLMDGEKADMVYTDPPYGMFLDTDFTGMKGIFGIGKKYSKVIGDNADFSDNLINTIFSNFSYVAEIFIWGADYFAEFIPKRNDGCFLVWDKMQGGEGVNYNYDKMFGSNFELCWSKKKHKRAIARVLWKGIFGLGKEDTTGRVHPTQKPTLLCDWFIERFSSKNQIIVDLYAGSGSLFICAENNNRKCYAMELDPKYVDVIIKRWEDYTGKKAELVKQ